MKRHPPRIACAPRPAPSRIPHFHAVPGRARADGWTPRRQAEFIGHLAETRSVARAARAVGMARETAYRLRARAWSEGFNRAWDAAVGKWDSPARNERSQSRTDLLRKVTTVQLAWRVETGLWQVRMYRGRFVAALQKPDNSALLRLLARLDRAGVNDDPAGWAR